MKLSAGFLSVFLLVCCLQHQALAFEWQLTVVDQDGTPLDDAVIELVHLATAKTTNTATESSTTIKQQALNFVPFVSAVQVGTLIDFPNFDRTRHHVYSFSAAKMFEIQLYHDRPEAPIEFDKPGIVALGCNIHDYMEAYIFISDSPLLAVTDETGQVQFIDLPEGEYRLTIWHPFQQQDFSPEQINLSKPHMVSQHKLDVTHRPKQPTPQRGFGS